MCEIPQPRKHFPTKQELGQQVPRSVCAPCRTAIDGFLVHIDWREARYACSVCGGLQGRPFHPNVCTECGQIFRLTIASKRPLQDGEIRTPLRNGKRILIQDLREMFHRNWNVRIMQEIAADVGLEDTTAIFDRYRPKAMLTCPCDTIAQPRTDASNRLCAQTLDFWEIHSVLSGEL